MTANNFLYFIIISLRVYNDLVGIIYQRIIQSRSWGPRIGFTKVEIILGLEQWTNGGILKDNRNLSSAFDKADKRVGIR
jgi:hypothetical protein